jgi:hypothetical protein
MRDGPMEWAAEATAHGERMREMEELLRDMAEHLKDVRSYLLGPDGKDVRISLGHTCVLLERFDDLASDTSLPIRTVQPSAKTGSLSRAEIRKAILDTEGRKG